MGAPVLLCNENRGFGGGEVHTVALARVLARHGCAITLLCRRDSWLDGAAAEIDRRHAPFANEIDALTVLKAGLLLRHHSVAHAHAGRDHLLVGTAARLRGVPMVRTLHSFLEPSLSGLSRRVLQRHTDRVICVSNALRAQALEYGVPPDRAVVIPNGIDVSRFAPSGQEAARRALGLPLEAPVVGVVSGLWDLKGPDLLLEAMARVPRVTVAIAGDGPMEAQLRGMAEAHAMTDRVVFLGRLSDPRPVYAAADLVVMASRQDAFPLVALEAQACGRPLVAFAVGGIPEASVNGVTSVLVEPLDTAGLAQAVSALLDDPARAEAMGRAAEAHVREHFSEDVMAGRVIALYEAVIEARARGENAR
ncbi:MAG: glycosyltransferase family 1 protein [Proteobacteria bacterium]|nr:glycosyltransferase family 1 protein [Pseudomonadota bacterium]